MRIIDRKRAMVGPDVTITRRVSAMDAGRAGRLVERVRPAASTRTDRWRALRTRPHHSTP
jgi:hypothetical protein